MSVATKNPFALLDDDAPAVPQPAPKAEPAPAPAPQAARGGAQKSRGGPAARGGKYYSRGGKAPTKDSAPVTEDADGQQKKFDGPREGREGGRGRGRGRGGPRGRGRPFDRHSQTGKVDSDKKVHQSWGGDDGNTELKAEEAAAVDANAESAANEWAPTIPEESNVEAWAVAAADADAPVDADVKAEGRGRKDREPEEEDNTLTLDQYLAQQKEKDTIIPKLENTRKANDGAEDIFKDAVLLDKDEEDAYFVGKGKAAPKVRAKKEEKVYLEIDARFERPDRGGRGRGGRGGDRGDRNRGSRGRGGPRGGRQNGGAAPFVNVDDQTAFPSLS